MKSKAFFPLLLGLLLAGSACNKEVNTVPIPPFTVFPNPFTDGFLVQLDISIPANAVVAFRVLDGKDKPVVIWEDPAPDNQIFVSMSGQKKAVYYAELKVGNEVFIQPILKAE